MIIKNASVYTPEGKFEKKDIVINGEYFAEKAKADEEVLNAGECYAIPGLTDIHFHGCGGYDFCDGEVEAIHKIASFQAKCGVTGMIPATMTLDEESLLKICRAASSFHKAQDMGKYQQDATFWGIYLEGPFISKEKKGAQNGQYIRKPDKKLYDAICQESGRLIKLVTIAPEEEGAMEFIRDIKKEVIVSIGHTKADYNTALAAFENGAGHVTHLYNAMEPFSHRQPGVTGAAADSGASVELICDGIHVHPAMVRSTIKMMGEDRVIFVSDSMRAAGLPEGTYSLGKQEVTVIGNRAILADGTIAGSVKSLMDCMKIAVKEMRIPLETAVRCAAVNPAKKAGVYQWCGSIELGKTANLVLLDKENLTVRKVFIKGQELF